jgi:hypothetical protein
VESPGGLPISLSTVDASPGPKLKIYIVQSGAAGAALAVQPPSQPPNGSKEDDETCPSSLKEEYKSCSGADAVGLCKSGTEAGCPYDEVQHCPNEPPLCSDATCRRDVSTYFSPLSPYNRD